MSLIYLFGFIRLILPEEKGTYNIGASIGISNEIYEHEQSADNYFRELDEYVQYINDTMRKAKGAGCQIMTYAEEAFGIYLVNKTEIIDRVSKLAQEYQIYVLLPLDIGQDNDINTNEAILISDKGDLLYNYQKQHLVPYIESDYDTLTDEVKVVNTSLGKMTVVICYDINFPYFINNLSREHLDILLIPSWDWDGIAEFHSVELRYRAIENGFNTIKNTANGNTISFDYKGRILSYFISKDCEDYFLVNTINRKGVKTLYSYIGIFFNYFYLLAIICILISGIINEKFCSKKNRDESISRFNELEDDMNKNDEDN
jgi:apolipoprotein N-acyltransferase